MLQGYSWTFEQTNSIIVPLWKWQDLLLFHEEFEHYGDQFILIEVVNVGDREIKHLYIDWIFCCPQVWLFWEEIQCVAHSPLIVVMTIALLFSLGTCLVQMQSVWVNFAWARRLFNLSAEANINARDARLCARCAIFLWKIKRFPFSCHSLEGFTFLKRVQNQFKRLLEMCIVLASIVPTEKNVNLLTVM